MRLVHPANYSYLVICLGGCTYYNWQHGPLGALSCILPLRGQYPYRVLVYWKSLVEGSYLGGGPEDFSRTKIYMLNIVVL